MGYLLDLSKISIDIDFARIIMSNDSIETMKDLDKAGTKESIVIWNLNCL